MAALATNGSLSTVNVTEGERYTPSLLPTERVTVVVEEEMGVVVGLEVVLVLLLWTSVNNPFITGGTQCNVPSPWRMAGAVITPSPSPCPDADPSPCPSPCADAGPKTHTSATAAFSTDNTTVGRLHKQKDKQYDCVVNQRFVSVTQGCQG